MIGTGLPRVKRTRVHPDAERANALPHRSAGIGSILVGDSGKSRHHPASNRSARAGFSRFSRRCGG